MSIKTTLRWLRMTALVFAWLFLPALHGSVGATALANVSVPTPGAEIPVPEPTLPIESPWSSVAPQQADSRAVIVDNLSLGFRVEAGEWGTCSAGDCSGTCYGDDFRYADPGCTSCLARFDLAVPQDGDYNVWTWWPWGDDRATDTPFIITSSQGDMTLNVDQRNGGDDWVWLTSLSFEANESVSVVVQGAGTGYANADAVAITPVEVGPPSIIPTVVMPPGNGSVSIIFLHHSCGTNLIGQGDVREQLTELGYAFYDHGYNDEGLVLADGTWTGRHFDVPDDNTNPDGLAAIFAQPLHDPPDNTFSYLMQYDVIVFKSCYPVSLIESDDQLEEYKAYYTSIRNRMDQYPNKLFIIVTQPPEIPNDTNSEAAARARAFANWLAAPEFLTDHPNVVTPNVVTFDFFDLLADPVTNMLRVEYMTDDYDAHPNRLANQTIGPIFSQFVDKVVRGHLVTQ